MVTSWIDRVKESFRASDKAVTESPDVAAEPLSESELGVYDVQTRTGQSSLLIIAFSGVGDVANDPEVRFEWGNTLERACEHAHFLFIKDNARRWYTDPNGHAAVVECIEAYKAEHRIERTIAFGLSMGGYGALVFSTLTIFDDVVALATRSCVGEKSAFDSRNRALMKQIPDGPYASVLEHLRPETRYTFLTSFDQVNDLMHFYHQYVAWPQGQFFVTRGDHNIGKDMNMRGEMGRFLSWMSQGCEPADVPAGIQLANETAFTFAKFLVDSGRSAMKYKEWQQVFGAVPAAHVPLFLLPNVVQQDIERGRKPAAYPSPTHAFIAPPYLHPYLGMGWYFPESGGVWSQGEWHELKGRVLLAETPETEVLDNTQRQIRLSFGLINNKSQTEPFVLESWVEGKNMKTVRIERNRAYPTALFALPVDAEGYFSLLLRTPETFIPADTSDSTDTRELALFLKGFVIT